MMNRQVPRVAVNKLIQNLRLWARHTPRSWMESPSTARPSSRTSGNVCSPSTRKHPIQMSAHQLGVYKLDPCRVGFISVWTVWLCLRRILIGEREIEKSEGQGLWFVLSAETAKWRHGRLITAVPCRVLCVIGGLVGFSTTSMCYSVCTLVNTGMFVSTGLSCFLPNEWTVWMTDLFSTQCKQGVISFYRMKTKQNRRTSCFRRVERVKGN